MTKLNEVVSKEVVMNAVAAAIKSPRTIKQVIVDNQNTLLLSHNGFKEIYAQVLNNKQLNDFLECTTDGTWLKNTFTDVNDIMEMSV